MASIIDAFNEALNEDFSYIKFIVYGIPVYFVANFFMIGKMGMFMFYGSILLVILFGLLTQGINNVRMSRREILTLNPLTLLISVLKTMVVLIPNIFIFGILGKNLTKIEIPIDLPHVPLIYSSLVWAIILSIVLTSYLSFAKYLKITQAFNVKVILESCIDVLVSLLFFIPQLLVANLVLIGPIAYLFFFFQIPFTNWGFVAYCSAALIVNISILANYFAQSSYEHIKGNNEEYNENVNINVIDDINERMG